MAERNDPCPCGSGRKYKKCCLEKAAGHQTSTGGAPALPIGQRDIPGVIQWLERFASDPLLQAHLRLIPSECLGVLSKLSQRDPELDAYLNTVITEAAVAQLAREGWGRKLASRWSPAQARYLQEMATSPLRAWNVLESHPGDGFLLEDTETGETVRVVERSGSREVVAKQRIGARVLRDMDQPSLSHFFRIPDPLFNRIRQGRAGNEDLAGLDPREALEVALVREFVRLCTSPPSIPEIMDAATGGRVEFVRDRFIVVDRKPLERWLESCPELDLDPKDESFVRFEDLPGGIRRSLGQLEYFELRGKMVLEIHSPSREAANDNRAWLKDRAGNWLRFTSRKIEAPEDMEDSELEGVDSALPLDPSEIMTPEFMERIYREHAYRDWGNTRIPALDNQTPRQCARTERGEAQVVDLVRSYQAQENQMAQREKRKPVDLSWLLAEAGIERRG